ncbi:MAG: GatB/YqeY domain-containing protein [Acidobacteriaceae bacterium]
MGLLEQVQKDMVAAMKSREEARLSTLRMMKSALKNKEIDKRAPLTDAEAVQVLATLVKQRRESVEQFTQGNRPELAAKEAAEIPIIEHYMPRGADAAQVRSLVQAVITEISAAGSRPTAKEMGSVMKAVQAKVQAEGLRADGKLVSEIVRAALA